MATPQKTQRKSIDCRRFPSEMNCSLKISGTEDEVLELAVIHATTTHGHTNTPELREQLRSMLIDEQIDEGISTSLKEGMIP